MKRAFHFVRHRQLGMVFWLAAAIAGCGTTVPGYPPLVGPPPAPIVPEPLQCGKWEERPVTTHPVGQAIVGAADFHNHQFANLGFGGRFLWGEAFDEHGIAVALSTCGPEGACLGSTEHAQCRAACALDVDPAVCQAACDHRACATLPPHGAEGSKDVVGLALGQGIGHTVRGYPEFIGWPHWSTYTHQQVYHRWLRRAFDGGLKLIVMHAVSNEVLCKFHSHSHGCTDMMNVDLQLDAARDLEHFIDYQNDCQVNGNGWYRIATSPAQAREIIASGAMAVVLGIEVDTLFDCYSKGSCTPDSVRAKVDEYKTKGVTHLFPVHLFDNAFGGTAAANDFFNFGNLVVNKKLLDVRDCSAEGYEFHFGDASSAVNDLLKVMATALGVKYSGYPKHAAHCNKRGLTDLGGSVIRALMDSKMIIDVDHMSTITRGAVLDVAGACGYPGLVSGHSGFTEIDKADKKHEGQLTPEEVKRLVDLGGLLAPILHQGDRKQMKPYTRPSGAVVTSDCGDSAKSFAEAYLYAVDHANGAGVGFGSDLNGLAGMPTPRFGPYACGGDMGGGQQGQVSYPIALHGFGAPMPESQAGQRKFDINVDGFAHVGMFPDFVAELRAVGVSEHDLAPLFSSAEAYIALWERATQTQLHCPSGP